MRTSLPAPVPQISPKIYCLILNGIYDIFVNRDEHAVSFLKSRM